MSADEDPPRAPREPLAYAIPRFAVSRPVTILMILATILVVVNGRMMIRRSDERQQLLHLQ